MSTYEFVKDIDLVEDDLVDDGGVKTLLALFDRSFTGVDLAADFRFRLVLVPFLPTSRFSCLGPS